jgi:hypothetical protein
LPLLAFAQEAPPVIVSRDTRALDVTLWLGSGQDVGLGSAASAHSTIDPRDSQARVGAGAVYLRQHGRVLVDSELRATARVDSASGGLWGSDDQASLAFALQGTRHTRIESTQVLSYAAVNPFAAASASRTGAWAPGTLPLDYPILTRNALTYGNDASLTHVLSRATSVAATYSFTYSDTRERRPLMAHLVGGRFERRLSATRTLRLGYRTGSATFDAVPQRHLQTHDVNVGLDYSRSLPFSRRTSIVTSSGSSLVTDGTRRSFRLLGNVSLTHHLGQAWQARVNYDRPMQIVEGLAAPLITNSVTGSLTRGIGHRSHVTAIAGHSDGSVGLDARDSRVKSSTASLQWESLVTPHVAWNALVFYGWSRFGPGVSLPAGVPHDLQRAGVRLFLAYKPPVFRN